MAYENNITQKRDKKVERNNNDLQIGTSKDEIDKMKTPCQGLDDEEKHSPSEDHLFTAFSYNTTSKRLTMIPIKYKIKEERRKVLKISINKLKKIDDPESWLCRSVLINNTMKKLQKEARDEKMQKQMNTYSKSYLLKTNGDSDDFGCQINSNNNNNNNNNNNEISYGRSESEICPKMDDQDCFYQKDFNKEKEDVFCQLNDSKSDEFHYQLNKTNEIDDKYSNNKLKPVKLLKMSSIDEVDDKLDNSLSNGVPLNEDFVEKIPSIKRCASRKRSLDEDGTASEVLNLNESDLEVSCNRKRLEADDVDECDVHDVLSQLYMPPTPRMLTSIDSDTDEDDLNVVDIDSSYMDNKCQNKLPNDKIYDSNLLPTNTDIIDSLSLTKNDKRPSPTDDYDTGGSSTKKRKLNDDIFSCFNVCETNFLNNDYGKKECLDNFLSSNKVKETERTSPSTDKESLLVKNQEEEELIELEDEEDIKRRLSQSLSSHYNRKNDKTCDSFFEDGCDNQYSCGHTVNMFNDIQSVTFHNLIASLET